MIIFWKVHFDCSLLTDFYAVKPCFKLGKHLPSADLYRHVLAGTTFEQLTFDAPLEINHDLKPLLGSTLALLPGFPLLTQLVEHRVKILIVYFSNGFLDRDRRQIQLVQLGINLKGSRVGHVLLLFATD